MTSRTRKWVHAGAVAVIGALADLGAQLAGGQLVNAPRTVIVGILIGGLARVVGAMLAAIPMDDATDGGSGG